MSLVGRERERLAALACSGGSLLIVGEPGVGKSVLPRSLSGHLVVGVEAEQDLPYAGLHQVLQPFVYRKQFSGRYEHRILDGIGHNVPQEAPEAFTRAVLDASR